MCSFPAEGYLYLAQLRALERCHCVDRNVSKAHVEKGRAALEKAISL